jgi:hypothetical protein
MRLVKATSKSSGKMRTRSLDDLAQVRGVEALVLQLHVPPVHDRRDDLRVGGGAPDAERFQFLHQARLGEARGRLGEVLLRLDPQHPAHVPLRQGRQRLQVVQPPVFAGLGGLPIEAGEALELHDRSGGPEQVGPAGGAPQVEVRTWSVS